MSKVENQYMDKYDKWKESQKKQGYISKLINSFRERQKEKRNKRLAYYTELHKRASNGDLVAFDLLKKDYRNPFAEVLGLSILSIFLCIMIGWYGYAVIVLIVLLLILLRVSE